MTRLLVAAALAAGLQIASATAQDYPSRPITIVVPFPPGGPTDTVGRVLAEHMKATLGQTVVVENVPGAGGTIGFADPTKGIGFAYLMNRMDHHLRSPRCVALCRALYGAVDGFV